MKWPIQLFEPASSHQVTVHLIRDIILGMRRLCVESRGGRRGYIFIGSKEATNHRSLQINDQCERSEDAVGTGKANGHRRKIAFGPIGILADRSSVEQSKEVNSC